MTLLSTAIFGYANFSPETQKNFRLARNLQSWMVVLAIRLCCCIGLIKCEQVADQGTYIWFDLAGTVTPS